MSVILVVILFLGWQPAAKNARGNELYHQEKYDEALAAYNEALAEDGENTALLYNRGNALYRVEQYPTAVQAYANALEGLEGAEPLGGRAYYNMGNSLYRMGRLQESIEAYKEGLRIESDDLDMKYNLEFVTRQLQEQQEAQDRRDAQDQRDGQDDQDRQDAQDEQDDQDAPEDGRQQPEEGQNPEQERAPREGELSREQAERLLNALNRDEQDIQRRLRRQQATQVNPEKDW